MIGKSTQNLTFKNMAFKLAAPLLFVMVLMADSPAHAFNFCLTILGTPICMGVNQCTSPGGISQVLDTLGDRTIGDVICNLISGSSLIPTLLAAISYLFGLTLVVFGILKTREHVENPQQVQIWEPIKRFVAGGAFLALPIVLEAAMVTITGGDDGGGINNFKVASGAPSGGGLDALMFFFILDIFKPMLKLVSAFSYLAGIILVMIGIGRLLKTSQEGAKGPGGIGTIFTFLVAGILLSIDKVMGAAVGTMFGDSFTGMIGSALGVSNSTEISSFGILSLSTGSASINSHIEAVISSVVGFMIIVGVVAFVRGIFILRDVAEGNQQASLMAAGTHIIGGALAVNIGGVINAVQSTFGLSVVSFI